MSCPVIRNEIGWETSVLPVTLTAVGSRLFEGLKELRIMQMHRDIVSAYPSTLEDERGVKHEIERLGATKECEVQGMYVKGRFMGVQGHPEFTEGIVREILTSRWTKGIFDDAEYEEAMKRVGNKQDGVIVAKAMLRFLLDD